MRGIWLVLAVSVAVTCAGVTDSLAAGNAPKELAAAEEAFKSNLAIGEAAAGKPATMEQISDGESFFQAAVAQVRQVLGQNAGLPEARHLLGMILCTGYRAVQVEAPQSADGEAAGTETVFVLRRGGVDCQEGLGELRSVLKAQPTYQIDYANALLICGDATAAEQQALAAWKLTLAAPARADCARVLAQVAQQGNRKQDEIRWLREVVKYDPQDSKASARLAKLAPPPPTSSKPKVANAIAWTEYESGIAQAEKQKKPVLMDFGASWCAWCKKLEKEVFPNKEVIALSQRFVCVKVDGDQRTDLTAKYGVDSYPTTVIVDYDGTELGRTVGYSPAEEYVADLKAALAAKERK
ncbi:MAG: DUF255 domain-containing protein [Armatimonadota bacterium]